MSNLTTQSETKKLKIAKRVSNPTTEDIEISLPYFCRYGQTHIKIIDEKECIVVETYSCANLIEARTDIHPIVQDQGTVEISETEFDEAFQAVLTKIQNL